MNTISLRFEGEIFAVQVGVLPKLDADNLLYLINIGASDLVASRALIPLGEDAAIKQNYRFQQFSKHAIDVSSLFGGFTSPPRRAVEENKKICTLKQLKEIHQHPITERETRLLRPEGEAMSPQDLETISLDGESQDPLKTFKFNIPLNCSGRTPEEAWATLVDGIKQGVVLDLFSRPENTVVEEVAQGFEHLPTKIEIAQALDIPENEIDCFYRFLTKTALPDDYDRFESLSGNKSSLIGPVKTLLVVGQALSGRSPVLIKGKGGDVLGVGLNPSDGDYPTLIIGKTGIPSIISINELIAANNHSLVEKSNINPPQCKN